MYEAKQVGFLNVLKKLVLNAKILFNSFFRGLKSADEVMLSQTHGGGEVEIMQEKQNGGVINDIMQGKHTQEVEEFRDMTYRIYIESGKYQANVKWCEEGPITGTAHKKTLEDFLKHPPVLVHDGEKLRVIQDNFHISKGMDELLKKGDNQSIYDYNTTLEISRSFLPSFHIEKFVTKIVVKSYGVENKAKIDLYLSSYASQFGKLDAILVARLNELFDGKAQMMDFLEMDGMEFNAYKAWNSDDLCLFKYNNIHFINIEKFDGSFVLEFVGDVVSDGGNVTEKYKKASVTNAYEKKTPKSKATDIFALSRKIEKDDDEDLMASLDDSIKKLESTTFKF